MTLDELKAGDKLIADDGFTCLTEGHVCEVENGPDGLLVRCAEGTHYLDGQLNDEGEVIGFKRA